MSSLIGALRVTLSADTAQFSEGMRKAQVQATTAAGGIQKALGGLKGSLAGVAAGLSAGLFVNAIKGALEYAGSLAELAQQVGVTAKDLQTFRFAAGQVGVSQEQLETGLSKLTITLGKVAAGAKAPVEALNAIGVTVDQLKGKDTGDAFRIIADGLQKVTDRSQRAAIEVALFGKAGASLDNLLSGGSTALNALSAAAEKLGLVLSDEEIAKADETADKLDALKTVLSAQIAKEVTANADAILGLANALGDLVGLLGRAGMAWNSFMAAISQQYSIPALFNRVVKGQVYGYNVPGQSVTVPLPAARPARKTSAATGGNIGKFLAGGGGGSKHKTAAADHSAEDALRDQHQFDQDERRAQMDIIRAKQELATDYIERTSLSIDMLNAEKEDFEAELQYQIALSKLTKGKEGLSEAQAAVKRALYDQKDSLERQKVLQDEQEQRQRDIQELTQHDFERRRDVLQSQAAIAQTAAERRKVELEILRIAYEQKRQALQNIIDTSKSIQEQEDARRDLANLNATYGNDQQAVMRGTRGPLEEWAASVPQSAAQINEALQSIEANGLEGLSEAIAGVISGTENLKDAFGDATKSIIADIIRMSVRMLIFRALSGILGGALGGSSSNVAWSETGLYPGVDLPGFASGGSMRILGRGGTDRNVLSVNGLPVARVSAGERINIANDNVNGGGSGSVTVIQHNDFAGGAVTRDDLVRMHSVTVAAATKAISEKGRRSS